VTSDSERVLFMEVEDDSEEEGEVDLREELISALEELRKERKKNKSLKEELKMKEGSQNSNSEEIEQMITSLKIQIEEDKRIEEILRSQLEEKEKMIGSLEAEIVSLRKDLQKKDMQQKSTRILDQIINSQRPSNDRSRLGYNQVHNEKGSSSKTTKHEAEQRSYAEIVRDFVKKEECKPPKKNIPEIKKTQEDEFRRSASQRRSSTPRYQRFFYGHCFNCANFGHKVVNCRAYAKNRSNYAGYLNNSYPRKSYEAYNRNQNSFGSLRRCEKKSST
jgi:hypothetical protein